jgi:hypothetical protein
VPLRRTPAVTPQPVTRSPATTRRVRRLAFTTMLPLDAAIATF